MKWVLIGIVIGVLAASVYFVWLYAKAWLESH